MTFEKYNGKGLNGLANLGNTCFMNSVLQCLAHTYELFEIEEESKTENIFDIKIFDEYFKLIHFMWNEDSTISPNGFLKYVQFVAGKKNRDMFTGFDQNDFSEFLLFMISCFHESIKKRNDFKCLADSVKDSSVLNKYLENLYEKDYSKVTDLFSGIQLNTVYNKETNEKINTTVDQFTILSLPVPDKTGLSIYNCLDEYFKEIELTGDDKYVLPDTHEKSGEKVDALMRHKIWSLPDILILNLLRVKIRGNRMTKNESTISYDEQLDLTKYCSKTESKYSLYAIGEHHGNLHGGHYTCLIKNANGKWYRFNDMKVSYVNSIITNRAYTFFYRKNL